MKLAQTVLAIALVISAGASTEVIAQPQPGDIVITVLDSEFEHVEHTDCIGIPRARTPWIWGEPIECDEVDTPTPTADCDFYFTFNRSDGENMYEELGSCSYFPEEAYDCRLPSANPTPPEWTALGESRTHCMPANYATWKPSLPGVGYYEVWVEVPAATGRFGSLGEGITDDARYQLFAAGEGASGVAHRIRISHQTPITTYTKLGTFRFLSDGSDFLYVDDVNDDSAINVPTAPDPFVHKAIALADVIFRPVQNADPDQPTIISDFALGGPEGGLAFGDMANDPVNPSTGNFIRSETDVRVLGLGESELVAHRFYNAHSTYAGHFGLGWSFIGDMRLETYLGGSVSVRFPDGQGRYFAFDGSEFSGTDGVFDTLEAIVGGWLLTTPDQWTYEFEAYDEYETLGRIIRQTDRHGNSIVFSWSGDELQSMTDASGRSLAFTHDAEGRIASMRDPINRRWRYGYGGDHLVSVTGPRSDTTRYGYDAESACMSSITDPYNTTYLRNVFEVVDDRCRVIEQYDAADSKATFTYAPGQTTFTDYENNTTIYFFDDHFRRTRKVDAEGEAENWTWSNDYKTTVYTDKRGFSSSSTWDDHGNLLSTTSPRSGVTAHTYNAENDRTSTTDAEGNRTDFTWQDGNIIEIHYADGGVVHQTFDNFGQIETRTNQNNNTTEFFHDGDGNLEEVVTPLEYSTFRTFDGIGRVRSITDGNNNTRLLSWDAGDNLRTTTDAQGVVATYTHNLNDVLIKLVDRRGGIHEFEYGHHLKMTARVDPAGHRTEFEHNRTYHTTLVRDPKDQETTFVLDRLYRPIEIHDAGGGVTHLERDENGNVERRTDAENGVWEYEYTPGDLLDTTTDAEDGVWRVEYNRNDLPTAFIDARNKRSEIEYDPRNRPDLWRDALNGEREAIYDKVGNVIGTIDENDNEIQIEFDEDNRPVKVTDAENHVESRQWDAHRLTATINGRLARTEFSYTPNDWLAAIKDPMDGVVQFEHDEEGARTAIIDQNDNRTEFEIDIEGLVKTITEPGGLVTTLGRDENHNVTTFTNAKDNTWTTIFDELNRWKSISDPLAHTTAVDRDYLGRITKRTDAEGNSFRYDFDHLSRLVTVFDALGVPTSYGWDEVSNLITITDGNGNGRSFAYDDLNRPIREQNAEGAVWTRGFDPVGNLASERNARGQLIQHEYNRDNLPVRTTFPDMTPLARAYDAAHNQSEVSNTVGILTWTHDLLNRPTEEINHFGQRVTFGYDKASNRTSLTYPDGSALTTEYDENNRPHRIQTPEHGVMHVTYDKTHNPVEIEYPNRTESLMEIDEAERLVSVLNRQRGGEVLSQYAYALDKVGNRVRTEQTRRWPHPRSLVTNYTYDDNYQLRRADDSLGRFHEFQYDRVGNRTLFASNYDPRRTPVDVAPYTVNTVFDRANRPVSSTHSVFGTTSFLHDLDGNRMLEEGPDVTTGALDIRRKQYAYDSINRMTGALSLRSVGGGNWQGVGEVAQIHDGIDRLTRRSFKKPTLTGGGIKSSNFVYDGLDSIAEFLDPSPRSTYYYRSLGRLVGLRDKQGGGKGGSYFYHPDGLGSTSTVTGHRGQGVHAYDYTPYGVPIDNNGKLTDSSNFTNPHNSFTFTGHEWVEELGQYDTFSRNYDPFTGTWLSVDQYRGRNEEPFTLHRYQYVGNNPVNFVDLYGFDREAGINQCSAGGTIQGDASAELARLNSEAESRRRQRETFLEHHSNDFMSKLLGAERYYEISQATVALSDGSRLWKTAIDHPYATAVAVGVGGGAAAYAIAPLATSATTAAVTRLGPVAARVGTATAASAPAIEKGAEYVWDGSNVVLGVGDLVSSAVSGDVQGTTLAGLGLIEDCISLAAPGDLADARLRNTLHRPYLRTSTRATIEERAPKTSSGKFLDPNTGQVIENNFHYGHVYGMENRRLQAWAEAQGMSQQEYNDFINSHPEFFQIEDPVANMSHKYEMPGP